MNSIAFRLRYFLGAAPWDSRKVPPELVSVFETGDIPAGPVLDLGCGTGTCVIYMATRGREAYGIDFVPAAIKKARARAEKAGVSSLTRLFAADVTRLSALGLPGCAFALDMGCFHGLRGGDRARYVSALADTLIAGGRYMLYALEPRKKARGSYGLAALDVEELFTPAFSIEQIQHGAFRGHGSNWFWMNRN